MAVFRYIGNNGLYDQAGTFSVSATDTAGVLQTYSFTPNVDFTVATDDAIIAALEYHIDPFSKELDFMRIS